MPHAARAAKINSSTHALRTTKHHTNPTSSQHAQSQQTQPTTHIANNAHGQQRDANNAQCQTRATPSPRHTTSWWCHMVSSGATCIHLGSLELVVEYKPPQHLEADPHPGQTAVTSLSSRSRSSQSDKGLQPAFVPRLPWERRGDISARRREASWPSRTNK
jgi:hypothetical protein